MNLYSMYFRFDQFAHDCFRKKFARDLSVRKLNDAKSVHKDWKKLTKEQKNRIAAYWGIKHPVKSDFMIHEIMMNVKGDFDVRYCPEKILRLYLDPTLTNKSIYTAWDDKCFFDRFQPNLPLPYTYVRNEFGYFLDHDYNPIGRDEAIKTIKEHLPVIIKPTFLSCEGRNLRLISSEEEFDEIFPKYDKDYVVQEVIVQCDELKKMSPHSVSTFRINTAMVNGEPKVINQHLLINTTDAVAVNSAEQDHMKGVGVIKVNDEGVMADTGYFLSTESFQTLPSGFEFGGLKIPSYKEAVKLSVETHKSMPMFGFIAWDVTIDENNKPVFFEWNMGGVEMFFCQVTNGPFFGEYSDYFAEISRKLINKK